LVVMSDAIRAKITFRQERWRSLFAGVIETAGNTFLLLIATREFDLGPLWKGLIAGGTSVGLLISPLMVALVRWLGMAPASAVSRLLFLGGLCCLAIGGYTSPKFYALGAMVALATTTCAIPLMTQIYHDNYPEDRRGKLYSSAFMLRIAAAMVFAWVGGQILEPQLGGLAEALGIKLFRITSYVLRVPGRWRVLCALFALAYFAAAWAVGRIPTSPLRADAGGHPLRALRFVRTDRVFRLALIAWMLMGFANLAMLPMRIEYLGNPRHGLSLGASEIALLTLVIPNAARLLMSPVWGRLFDRMNFFSLRVTLNIGFAAGIGTFFMSNSTPGLVVAAILYGISNAGGDVAWGLWVTKVAPPGHVTDYMAVHTFFTGIRGVLAPLVAFQAVQHLAPSTMGWISAGMILAASALLIPEIALWKPRRRGEAIPEDVQD
jgi:MFS family permease